MLAALAGIPVIILFEGWRGAQRSVIINHMMQQMDAPRVQSLFGFQNGGRRTGPTFF